MLRKTMVRGLFAVALAATMFGGTAMADVILPTQAQLSALGATQYQIAFVTTDKTSGTSGLESTYNTIAATDAAENATLQGLGATWTAVTSTSSGSTYTDASTNAPAYVHVPIFNTAGQLVLSDGSQLYTLYGSHPLSNLIVYTEQGGFSPVSVWTGGYAEVGYISPPLAQPPRSKDMTRITRSGITP